MLQDDKELNRSVCAYLNRNGYETVGCLNADEAYDAMYGGTLFDLIISDIMMPGVDGFEFAETVREQNQDIPILFMTARDDFAAFLTMCFIISCCMILFLQTLTDVTGLDLQRDMLSTAALLTFLNVIFLSLICAAVDALRRRLTDLGGN